MNRDVYILPYDQIFTAFLLFLCYNLETYQILILDLVALSRFLMIVII